MAGSRGRYHADPLLARYGILKIGDLYRQQLRVHAWQFWNGRLPENQAAMLTRTEDVHGYSTRSARAGVYLSTRDHGSVGYRIPREWAGLSEVQRGAGSLGAFKRGSKGGGFLLGMGLLSVVWWNVVCARMYMCDCNVGTAAWISFLQSTAV